MRALTVLIHDLAAAALADREKRYPALESFLSRCRCALAPCDNLSAWTCTMFGVQRQQDWPVAAILAQAAEQQNARAYWICAQPVHLAVDRDRLILQPPSQLRLSVEESRALFAAIETHFAKEQLQLRHIENGLWCVGTAGIQHLTTTEVEAAEGCSVDNLLPTGPDARRWQRLVTEAQMILHEHPVNAAREQRGEPAVNSLWLWGGGTLPAVDKHFDRICAADPLLRACATLTRTPLAEPPRRATQFFGNGRSLVELAASGDAPAALSALQSDWLAPAQRALKAGQLDELTLVLHLTKKILVCHCDRTAQRRFWKRKQPLVRFVEHWQGQA